MKKKILTGLVALSLCFMTAIPAFADTVNYHGYAINWDHGRKLAVYSYSDVGTHVFTHSATANSTFSGWKKPGVDAYAQQLVGIYDATAYWACR